MMLWNETMLVGIPHIDSQHKALLEAINQLIDACNKGKGRSEIEQTLNFMVSYTKGHFKDEERYQETHAYAGAAAHKRMHTHFIMRVGGLVQEFNENGPSVTLVSKINNLLIEWVDNHIKTEDRKFGDYINRKSA